MLRKSKIFVAYIGFGNSVNRYHLHYVRRRKDTAIYDEDVLKVLRIMEEITKVTKEEK